MQEFYNRLLQADLSQVPLLLTDALRNPAENPRMFVLIVVGLTTVLALVIMVVVLIFMSFTDDEEEAEYAAAVAAARAAAPQVAKPAPKPWMSDDDRRRWAPLFTLAWVAVVALIWVIGGFASRPDAVCLSCHTDDSIHTARLDESSATVDVHQPILCSECHETPSTFLSVTTAVPGRAMHFVGGSIRPRYADGYGAPVSNRNCAYCHESSVTTTTVNVERGLKMSHQEPLEANALCTDCHAPVKGSGVVNQYTVGMDPCMRCHDAEAASAECGYCHTKDVGFAVSAQTPFEPRSHPVDCSGCHSLKTCDACHGMRMPHSTEFMGAGHARPAVEDIWFNGGRTCYGCHTATRRPCTKCHGVARFPAHPPSYMINGHKTADPFNNGCDECHSYLAWVNGRNFCGNCHPKWSTPIQRGRPGTTGGAPNGP